MQQSQGDRLADQRCTSGGVEIAPICSSTSENNAVINATVIMLRFSS